MSKGNHKGHKSADMEHTKGNVTHSRPGKYVGSKFVKKANMTVTYVCLNTPNKTDTFTWS